jgi:hypothetical protein
MHLRNNTTTSHLSLPTNNLVRGLTTTEIFRYTKASRRIKKVNPNGFGINRYTGFLCVSDGLIGPCF